MASTTISSCLQQLASRLPKDLQHYPRVFLQLYEGRLWHQLTVSLEQFSNEPAAASELPLLFTQFIRGLQPNMSPLVFTRLAVRVAARLSHQEAVDLLEHFAKEYKGKVHPEYQAVYVLAGVECAHYKLLLGDLKAAQDMVDECKPVLERLMALDPSIHACFHRVAAEIAKARRQYSSFFQSTMAYLSHANVDALMASDPKSCQAMAHDLVVSALLSKDVYNFSELLGRADFLKCLLNTEHAFLLQLVDAFNSGDFGAAERLSPKVASHSSLKLETSFLLKKLKLMALAEGLFQQLKTSHIVPLARVAELCRTPVEGVEVVVLEAISLDIIQGQMNQVQGTLVVESVQPRFFNHEQLVSLRELVVAWRSRVDSAIEFVQCNVPESVVSN